MRTAIIRSTRALGLAPCLSLCLAALAACSGSSSGTSSLASSSASSGSSSTSAEPASGDAERCAGCHMDAFRAAKHHEGNRPDTCAICHTQQGWHPSVVNHPWPLAGAHVKASCFACHKGDPEKFKATSKECVSCHKKEYDRAPNHVSKKFPTQCAPCHDAIAWKDRIVP